MANSTTMKWQDWVALIAGIWLFFSPWILGFYDAMPAASWNFFVLGIAFVVFAAFGLNLTAVWEEWVNLVLGVWMIISPWVVAFSDNMTARNDAVIVGLIVAVMAIWSLADRHMLISRAGDHSLTH